MRKEYYMSRPQGHPRLAMGLGVKATFLCILLGFQLGYAQTFKDSIVVRAEVMPLWKGCEADEEPEGCTQEELEQYFRKHMKYPKVALEAGVQGVVGIGCIITKEGRVRNAKVIQDIGSGCDGEALRLVSNMPLWIPAQEEGQPVNVLYHIQVPFVLDDSLEAKRQIIVYEEPAKPRIGISASPDKKDDEPHLPVEFEDTPSGRVYTQISQMPYFPGCESLASQDKEKRECSNQHLVEYLSQHLEYPEKAKQEEIEGVVYVSFVVDEAGRVVSPEITRDIGGGCGEAGVAAVLYMPLWEPGRHKGQAVKTRMSLPLRFFLSGGTADQFSIHWGGLKSNRVTSTDLEAALSDAVVVRDKMGNHIPIATMEVIYERRGSSKMERSNGKITPAIRKLVRKMKKGGELYLIASIQEKSELVEVYRVFNIVD